MKPRHIQHLYWRAGFGISPGLLDIKAVHNKKRIVKQLFHDSRPYRPITVIKDSLVKIDFSALKDNKKAIRELNKELRDKRANINYAWVSRIANSQELLREKMTLFWANHFVCRETNSFYAERYNNTLRKHALGNFRTFVKAISKQAAMINYLNLKQNRKFQTNENFARELMELFTLGEGHYSEKDIKESARAFTGYNFNLRGDFLINQTKHDFGRKRFFNKTERFDGDDIIDVILSKEQCAQFICEKIYRYFVNENVNASHIKEMVSIFYPKYNIEKLMQYIFMSDWFYNEEHIGTKIKSPIEFLIGMHKTVPMHFQEPKKLMGIQKTLGQALMDPPSVVGWKGGKNWIDTNSILLRLRLPSVLLNNNYISIKEQGEFGDSLSKLIKRKRRKNFYKVDANWNFFEAEYKNIPIQNIKDHVLQTKATRSTEQLLERLSKVSKKEYCIQLMSLPEYQMC